MWLQGALQITIEEREREQYGQIRKHQTLNFDVSCVNVNNGWQRNASCVESMMWIKKKKPKLSRATVWCHAEEAIQTLYTLLFDSNYVLSMLPIYCQRQSPGVSFQLLQSNVCHMKPMQINRELHRHITNVITTKYEQNAESWKKKCKKNTPNPVPSTNDNFIIK